MLAAAPAAAQRTSFESPQAAFDYGLGALKAGELESALPALEFAAGHDHFLAEFYLARVYADSTSPRTDHGKAYLLYQKIANRYADVDPDGDQRAPFVAKALTALAGYLIEGVPQIGVKPNTQRAIEYLHHASTFFNDTEAQFELAKLYLSGDDRPEDVKRGMHWLSTATQKGHAGAQAYLADLYWRGKFVGQDPGRALALISVAVENAPPHERIWIEDTYQIIFCGTSAGTRRQVEGVVADWRRRYGRQNETVDRSGLGPMQPSAVRTCGNGEPVPQIGRETREGSTASVPRQKAADNAPLQGGMLGIGLNGVSKPGPNR
jgi:hypothetical protein